MDRSKILSLCDHTLLKPDCRAADIMTLCDEAMRFGCASVCIPACHVAGAKRYVGEKMRVCTVVGFPNGCMTAEVKAFETADAVKRGTDEIDMVASLPMIKDACWDEVLSDIKKVRAACPGKILKVIIECCLLTDEEKRIMCQVVSESGADFIKTSTGFSTGGATLEDVRLLRECCAQEVKVKAAGGISTFEYAEELVALGAERLGTSRLVKLAMADN